MAEHKRVQDKIQKINKKNKRVWESITKSQEFV